MTAESDGSGLLDLDELRTFVQIVDSGNMTAAGRVLGQSTNVVSRRLARLEQRLGVPLAQRTTCRLQPTEEGRRLGVRARRIRNEIVSAEAELREVTEKLTGRFGSACLRSSQNNCERRLAPSLRSTPGSTCDWLSPIDRAAWFFATSQSKDPTRPF